MNQQRVEESDEFVFGEETAGFALEKLFEENGVNARVLGLNQVQVQHPKRICAFEEMVKPRRGATPNQCAFLSLSA